MNRGLIQQVGAPADLYEFPSNRFVADFIGSVNLLEGRVAALGADELTISWRCRWLHRPGGRQVECAHGGHGLGGDPSGEDSTRQRAIAGRDARGEPGARQGP